MLGIELVKKEKINSLNNEIQSLRLGVCKAAHKIESLIKSNSTQAKEKSIENCTIEVLLTKLDDLSNYLKDVELEENRRHWASEGLTKFVDIIKIGNNDLQAFYNNVIANLVKFLEANQGGLFIANVEDEDDENSVYLELVACYAYNRKKYIEKRIVPGEGLIGQCYLEKEYILMSDIPHGYTTITSGLGEATPGGLLIYPLIADEKVVGIIELASFNFFEKHHLDFLKKLGENIASTIHNLQTNERTKRLLKTSNEQAEYMKQQEEELRQNMEELTAIQEQLTIQLEESKHLKKELEIREKVFGYTTIMSESDKYGTITYVNDKLCEVSKYSRAELIGKGHNIFRHPDMPKEIFKMMWDTIKTGKKFRGIVKNKAKDGTHYWVDAVIVPIKNDAGEIIKYLGARYHITNEELAVHLFKKQLEELELV